jgi:hypothetical protein
MEAIYRVCMLFLFTIFLSCNVLHEISQILPYIDSILSSSSLTAFIKHSDNLSCGIWRCWLLPQLISSTAPPPRTADSPPNQGAPAPVTADGMLAPGAQCHFLGANCHHHQRRLHQQTGSGLRTSSNEDDPLQQVVSRLPRGQSRAKPKC